MLDNFKNGIKTTVSTGYNSSATSIVLNTGDGAKLPSVPFNAVYFNASDYSDPSDDPNVEIVRVTAVSTDTLTITRAAETMAANSTAQNHNTGGKTYKLIPTITAKTLNTDIPGLVPSGIGWALKTYQTTSASSITVSSLNIPTDVEYQVHVIWDNASGTADQLAMRMDGDSGSNYAYNVFTSYTNGGGSSTSAGTSSAGSAMVLTSSSYKVATADFRLLAAGTSGAGVSGHTSGFKSATNSGHLESSTFAGFYYGSATITSLTFFTLSATSGTWKVWVYTRPTA